MIKSQLLTGLTLLLCLGFCSAGKHYVPAWLDDGYDYPEETSTTQEAITEVEETTAPLLEYYMPKYIEPCYIEKSRASDLLGQMNTTIQNINRKDRYLKCHDQFKIVKVHPEDFKQCSDARIHRVQQDLADVTSRLLQLAIRIEEPSFIQVFNLDKEKFQVIDDLKALRIFYGPSPCEESTIVLYPLDTLLEYMEYNLNSLLTLFQTSRPTRPPRPTTTTSSIPTTSTTPAPTINKDMLLDPSKSFVELTRLARLSPQAMSSALPSLIPQRYAGNASNLEPVLHFIKGLPTVENRIFGFAALHEDIRRYPPKLGVSQLLPFAQGVRTLKESRAATPELTLTQLAQDLSPLLLFNQTVDCSITNVAYQPKLFAAKLYQSYVYLHENPGHLWRIYPSNKTGKHTFRIRPTGSGLGNLLYAGNLSDETYKTKSSERYALRIHPVPVTNADGHWNLIPLPNKPNHFKILTANSDVLFAHSSAMVSGDFGVGRRVLLLKSGYSSNADLIPGADEWILKCSPGIYESNDV